MSILNRYVLRQVLVPCLLAVVLVAAVGVANEIQERVAQLPLGQMRVFDFARLAFYFLPTLVAYLVPVTYMLGILLAFGRLAQRNEIVAMKAAGIPLKQIVVPVIALGALLSVFGFVVQDRIQPWSIRQIYELVGTELPLRATLDALPTGVMHEYGGWRIYIGNREKKSGELHDIVILTPEDEGRATTYYAETARMDKVDGRLFLEMHNVHFVPASEASEGGRLPILELAENRLPLPPLPTYRPPANRREQNLGQLLSREKEMSRQATETGSEPVIRDLRKLRREMAERTAFPFACLAVCFVAAPLGARAQRSGRSYTFAVGFSVILTYYVLQTLTDPEILLPLGAVFALTWVPNVLFLLAGLVLVWKVDRV